MATALIKSADLKCDFEELENEMLLVTFLRRKENRANFPRRAQKSKGITNTVKIDLVLVVLLLRTSSLQIPVDHFQELKTVLQLEEFIIYHFQECSQIYCSASCLHFYLKGRAK